MNSLRAEETEMEVKYRPEIGGTLRTRVYRCGVDYPGKGYEVTVAKIVEDGKIHHIEVMEGDGKNALSDPQWYATHEMGEAQLYAFGLMVKYLQAK